MGREADFSARRQKACPFDIAQGRNDKIWSDDDEVRVGGGNETAVRAGWLGEFLKGYMRKKLGWAGLGQVILRMAILAALLRLATKRCGIEARDSGARGA
jgi:hypothetical protein